MLLDLLKAVLAPVIALLYSILIAHWPDFPLKSADLLALVLWLLSLIYSGHKVSSYIKHKKDWRV